MDITNKEALNLGDAKTLIQFLWSQGFREQAIAAEREHKKRGNSVGSCLTEEWLEKFITNDSEMLALKNKVRLLAEIDDPVLIQGESGTGKELIAHALHGSREGKFVAINCPALSTDLMESELFGHVKGAFTGAVIDRAGKFQHAWNGTLFIDEIGDMPLTMQAAILRALQEKVITRVGANEEIEIKCRIVCATNKDLGEMINNGQFRLDLLHRLNTFVLNTLPLRERPTDIPYLVEHFSHGENKPLVVSFDWENLEGNVRELQSIIRRWQVLGEVNETKK